VVAEIIQLIANLHSVYYSTKYSPLLCTDHVAQLYINCVLITYHLLYILRIRFMLNAWLCAHYKFLYYYYYYYYLTLGYHNYKLLCSTAGWASV